MKILVPTDFSKLASVAIRYAAELAQHTDAELILFHAVSIDGPPHAMAAMKTHQILEAMEDGAKNDLIVKMHELKKMEGPPVKTSYKLVTGHPVQDMIEHYLQHHAVDLIVMGTKGASGMKKVLMGSNAAAVIGKIDIPVITVPEHARFKPVKQIVYASDLMDIGSEMESLIRVGKVFDASIHILHIVSPGTPMDGNGEILKNELIARYHYPNLSLDFRVNENVEEAIEEFIADVHADMLAMFTHQPTFFEKLFGRSVTRELAFHSRIPLLSFKK